MSNANEPAFPVVESHETMGTRVSCGLSTRELFAAMAMQGLMANPNPPEGISYEMCAVMSIRQADELLKQLEGE
jgi:hypothetical protein